jgi:hypothetical protein
MQRFLLSVFCAFAVIFTASMAHAQSSHCINHPTPTVYSSVTQVMSPGDLRQLTQEESLWLTSHDLRAFGLRVRREGPNQSRPLVVCLDPNTPGCAVESPDTPERHASGFLAWDLVALPTVFENVPPADEVACAEFHLEGEARNAHSRSCWRPPAV